MRRQQLAEVRDRLFPRRMCAKKARYLSEREAGNVRRLRQRSETVILYVYHCPDCKGWHLTRMEQPA